MKVRLGPNDKVKGPFRGAHLAQTRGSFGRSEDLIRPKREKNGTFSKFFTKREEETRDSSSLCLVSSKKVSFWEMGFARRLRRKVKKTSTSCDTRGKGVFRSQAKGHGRGRIPPQGRPHPPCRGWAESYSNVIIVGCPLGAAHL